MFPAGRYVGDQFLGEKLQRTVVNQGMSLRQERLHKFPEKAGDQIFK